MSSDDADKALRDGLTTGGRYFVEKLEKITMMEIASEDEDELTECFEKLGKATSRGALNASNFRISDLKTFGFNTKYIQVISSNVIKLESNSPVTKKTRSTRRPSRSNPPQLEENNYQEDDFEDYDSDANAVTDNYQISKNRNGNQSKLNSRTNDDHGSPDGYRKDKEYPYSPARALSSAAGRRTAAWIAENNWRLGEQIGSGSFGEVFQGMNDRGKLFAVKRLKMAAGKTELLNLVEEIDLMRKLRHQNIVEYLGAKVDEDEGFIYIFQAWIPGGSVAHLLKRFGPFQVGVVRRYTRQVLWGLQYLHSNNIVHRDIKGGNILVDDDGKVKLADFGASTVIKFGETQETATIKGTPYFMAPEVLSQSKYGRKGDIWAVGCTIIQMLTGDPPWKENKLQGLVQLHLLLSNWEGIPPLKVDIPDTLRGCLDLCFLKNPEERPSANDLLKCEFLKIMDSDGLDDSMDLPPAEDTTIRDDAMSRLGTTQFDDDDNGLDGTIADLRKKIEQVTARDDYGHWRSGEDTLDEIDAQIRRREKPRQRGGGEDRDRSRERGERKGEDYSQRDNSRPRSRARSHSRADGDGEARDRFSPRASSVMEESPDQSRVPSRERGSPEVVANPYAKRAGGSRASSRSRNDRNRGADSPKLPVVSPSPRSHTRNESMQQGSARDSEEERDGISRSNSRPGSGSSKTDDASRNRYRKDKDRVVERDRYTPDEDYGNGSSRGERTPRSHHGVSLTPRGPNHHPDLSLNLGNISSPTGSSEHSGSLRSSRGDFPSARGGAPTTSRKDEMDEVSPRSRLGGTKDRTFERDGALDSARRLKTPTHTERLPALGSSLSQSQSSKLKNASVPVGVQGLLHQSHGGGGGPSSLSQSYRRGVSNDDEVLIASSGKSPVEESNAEEDPDTWLCEFCQGSNEIAEGLDYCMHCAKKRFSVLRGGVFSGTAQAPPPSDKSRDITRLKKTSQDMSAFATSRAPVEDPSRRGSASTQGSTTPRDTNHQNGGIPQEAEKEKTWDCKYCGKSNVEEPGVTYCMHCAKFRQDGGGVDSLKSRVSRKDNKPRVVKR